jgi:hypothetical protein
LGEGVAADFSLRGGEDASVGNGHYHDASALVPRSRQRRGKCRCSVVASLRHNLFPLVTDTFQTDLRCPLPESVTNERKSVDLSQYMLSLKPNGKQEVSYETEKLFWDFYCPKSVILFDRRKFHV